MSFFHQNQSGGEPLSQRQALENKYASARGNLLLVVAFTVINIVLAVINSGTYFLFSACIPYALVLVGMVLCGMYSGEEFADVLLGMEYLDKSVFVIFLAIALVLLSLYLLSFIFSKKNRVGWLIFALVLFSLDTLVVFVFGGLAMDNLIDIAFHVWVIVSLSIGIHSCGKLKKLNLAEAQAPAAPVMNFDPMTGEPIQK